VLPCRAGQERRERGRVILRAHDDNAQSGIRYTVTAPLGVGIIGVGRTARAVASACRDVEELRLVAVAEVDPEKGRGFAGRWGIEASTRYEELLSRPDVDVVFVLLPHFLHHPVGRAALEAGKHVFMEKPLACTVEECTDLIDAARRAGRGLMVGHHYHFTATTRAARRLVLSGELGLPLMALDVWHKPFFGETRPPWFLDASKGGGAWPMNAPHMIDRLMWATDRRVESVLAQVGNPIFGMSATDSGIAHLRFEGGFSATICHGAYRDGVPRFETEFVCTEAMLRVTADAVAVGRGGGYAPVPLEPLSPHLEQISAFAASLVAGEELPVTGEYGREVVAVLQATEESARLGREVRVPELLPAGARDERRSSA
jgi:predicted dehydrogenase